MRRFLLNLLSRILIILGLCRPGKDREPRSRPHQGKGSEEADCSLYKQSVFVKVSHEVMVKAVGQGGGLT